MKYKKKRRVDLVYNLADCVKQYDKHESETLKAVVEGRGSAGDIENVTTAITAVAEAYPELKSNENYKTLMNELSMTENLIAEHRSNYNKQVTVFAQLKDHTIQEETKFYENKNIEETVETLSKEGMIFSILFWVFWIALIIGIVCGFYYLDNEWLN